MNSTYILIGLIRALGPRPIIIRTYVAFSFALLSGAAEAA